jgi:hypothetical protein
VPPLTLWSRPGRGKPWVAVAEVPTLRAALDRMKGAGDFYVGEAGRDPNRPVCPAAAVRLPGNEHGRTLAGPAACRGG